MISRDPLVTLTVTLLIVMPLFFFTQSKNQAEDRELTVLNQRLNKLEQQLKNLDPLPSFDEVDSIAERKQLFFAPRACSAIALLWCHSIGVLCTSRACCDLAYRCLVKRRFYASYHSLLLSE